MCGWHIMQLLKADIEIICFCARNVPINYSDDSIITNGSLFLRGPNYVQFWFNFKFQSFLWKFL